MFYTMSEVTIWNR